MLKKHSLEKNSFLRKLLEQGKYNDKPFHLDDIIEIHKCACKIHFNRETNKYTLLVATKIVPEEFNEETKRNVISLDPGIRTFLTGISDNEVIKIVDNVSKRI